MEAFKPFHPICKAMKNVNIFLFLLIPLFAAAQNQIVIEARQGQDTISRFIYGHFVEHLGRCIYDGIYVGRDNVKIPNQGGIRMDVVDALKKLKVPVLRWPGGCFADAYYWRDGVGPPAARRPVENIWWGNVRETNAFGTHEFLALCEMLGAEPYLAVNVGSGPVKDAAEWVQYINHANGSGAMADLRQQHGRATPWRVTYWGVGNESWGCGGNMTVEFYVNLYRQYATYMTSYGNTEKLFRIAVGPGTEDYHWTEVLMRDIPRNMLDGISVHHYSVIDWKKKGSATRFSENEYYTTLKEAARMDRFISKNREVMDRYDPEQKVALIVDEWGTWFDVEPGASGASLYQQNTQRDAVVAAVTLNILNNHARRVRMANLAQMVNVLQAVILTHEEKLIRTPTYHVMEMFNVHHDALLLPSRKSNNRYIHGKDTIDVISVSASKNKNGSINVSLANLHARQPQQVSLRIEGGSFNAVDGRMLHAARLQEMNTFDQPNAVAPVAFKPVAIKNGVIEATLPPYSVVVLSIK
jgi:alpha-N-arabinofuranosidase